MNKNEFLKRLKSDLSSLSEEERLNALKYYEEYFADAGEDMEEEIIMEFVSPENLAHKIQDDDAAKNIFSEEPPAAPEPPKLILTDSIDEIIGVHKIEEDKKEKKDKEEEKEIIIEIKKEEKKEEKKENAFKYQPQNRNNNYRKAYNPNKADERAIITILLLCAAPIWLPIAIALASAAFGIFMAVMGAAFAVAAVAVAGFLMLGLGFVQIGFGITNIFFDLYSAFSFIGSGFIVAGLGLIMAFGFTKLAAVMFKSQFKFINWAIRGIKGKLSHTGA